MPPKQVVVVQSEAGNVDGSVLSLHLDRDPSTIGSQHFVRRTTRKFAGNHYCDLISIELEGGSFHPTRRTGELSKLDILDPFTKPATLQTTLHGVATRHDQ